MPGTGKMLHIRLIMVFRWAGPENLLPVAGEEVVILHMAATAGTATYDKNVEALEKIFSDAVAYAAVEKPKDVNLRLESLRGLVRWNKDPVYQFNRTKRYYCCNIFREEIWCKENGSYRS